MRTQVSPDYRSILRLHTSWADRYLVLWCGIAVLMFAGSYAIAKVAGVDAADRAAAYVILATVLVLAAIWHTTGLVIARIHMLLEGIALEAPEQRPPDVITGF
jgi:hypothetical protein